jgi:hypothetical protein
MEFKISSLGYTVSSNDAVSPLRHYIREQNDIEAMVRKPLVRSIEQREDFFAPR